MSDPSRADAVAAGEAPKRVGLFFSLAIDRDGAIWKWRGPSLGRSNRESAGAGPLGGSSRAGAAPARVTMHRPG